MERKNGFKYMIEGSPKLEEFALGILALVNAKTQGIGVVDFKTVAGTEIVHVILDDESQEAALVDQVGKILDKEQIDIYEFDEGVLELGDKETFSQIGKKLDETDWDYEYYFQYVD